MVKEHEDFVGSLQACREIYDEVGGDRRAYYVRTANIGQPQMLASCYFKAFNREAEQAAQSSLHELVDRFMHSADPISEAELHLLDKYYSNIQAALKVCPPEYRLVDVDAFNRHRRVLDALAAYNTPRKKH